MERLLGTFEYIDKDSKQKKKRPLMHASEIRELDNQIIVLPNGQKPLKVKITPAYKQSRLRKQLAMELELIEDTSVEYCIQYIDLKPYRKQDNNL